MEDRPSQGLVCVEGLADIAVYWDGECDLTVLTDDEVALGQLRAALQELRATGALVHPESGLVVAPGEPDYIAALGYALHARFGYDVELSIPPWDTRETDPACPCCGYSTLSSRGRFEVCRICWWEDDGQDSADADVVHGGPNGEISLTRARRNFLIHGICRPDREELLELRDEISDYQRKRFFHLLPDGGVGELEHGLN
jgi:hypothetical protein